MINVPFLKQKPQQLCSTDQAWIIYKTCFPPCFAQLNKFCYAMILISLDMSDFNFPLLLVQMYDYHPTLH